ncbi:MAG: hemolysin family protein [Candidatus Obscuribacterales bacterium]|nr:hemolysin family protein [Candidatus Obscuribacterales bacterium]
MALVRIRRTRVDQLVEQGNRTAKLIQDEIETPNRYISACQLGITFATLALGATGEATFAGDLAHGIDRLGFFQGYSMQVAKAVVYVAAFSFTAFVQTVFGELLPKQYTLMRAESVLMILIWPMRGWCWITWPFLNILEGFSSLVMRVLRIPEPTKQHTVHTGEELKMLVTASQAEGVLEEEEEEMIHSVFDFADTVAKEVMTPRTDMVCTPASSTIKDFIDLALQTGHSRLPVYEEDIDSIYGAAHIRDALRAVIENRENESLRNIVKKILVVPENKPAGDLLTDFKKNKTHMAIVVDEYGGTLGVITMEDLIEELVGDIPDEHDEEEEGIIHAEDGSIIFDAKMSLDDASEMLGITIDDEEFTTVGGHVFGELGHKPQAGDQIETEDYILMVENADRHRIIKLRLIKKQNQEEAAGETNGNGHSESHQESSKSGSKSAEMNITQQSESKKQ